MNELPGLYLDWDTNTAGALTRARSSVDALRCLIRLRAEGRKPTDDERGTLAQWSGWGPLAPLFDRKTDSWQALADEVLDMLSAEEAEAGAQATYSAFYTPPAVASACWSVLSAFGFDGGTVLDPGCGAGVFAAHAPADTDRPVRMVGVERDPTTAAIAALIHPDMRVIASALEDAKVAECSVDAVIGNVPFGDVSVFDPAAPDAVKDSLHGYFVWRSLRALRPGGVAVLITSRYLLDRARPQAREAIGQEGQFLGAIRMPGDALATGGTSVVTDIVVFRKPRPGDEVRNDDDGWVEATGLDEVGGEWVNQWVAANRDMVLGTLTPDRAPHYGRTIKVVPPDGAPKGPEFARWIAGRVRKAGEHLARRARRVNRVWDVDPEPAPDLSVALQDAQGRKERSFHLVRGQVRQVRNGVLRPVTVKKDLDELRALIGMRDATVSLLDAEADHGRPDDDLVPLRAELNALYDAYVARFGYLNRSDLREGLPDDETGEPQYVRIRPTMGGFRMDPDYVAVLALEVWDDETHTASKAPILLGRVNKAPKLAERADTPAEALALCLDRYARVNLAEIGRLLSVDDPADVPALLGDLVYHDPAAEVWQTADEYLSGNVRAKLAVARRAAERDPDRYGRNVAALEKTLPADLKPGEIRAKLGQSWIPPNDVADFLAELLAPDGADPSELRRFRPRVTRIKVTADWEVKYDGVVGAKANAEWGTDRVNAYRLAELYCNGKAPVVYDKVRLPDGSESSVRNMAATQAAEAKQQELANRFSEWVWEDPARADRLAAEYNRLFNSHVVRAYDGSHLTFPGMADFFTPYTHQRDMVQRMLCTPRALCGHAVGGGKTAIAFMGALTLRRLGMVNKPMIVVPNHLLEQVAREGRQLFPSARILICGKEDLKTAEDRKLFAARCATGDWDAVVVTHSVFGRVPVHPLTEARYLHVKVEEFRLAIAERDGQSGKDRKTKQLQKDLDRMRTRARELLHKRVDDGLYFEQLGVDYLAIDEAHYYKNLSVPVRTEGFSVRPSKRATDLDMKLKWLSERRDRCATLFTGTPVSNTMLELFVMQSYLAPELLAELGIETPDAWAADFVKFETRVEVAPDGVTFRMKRRPSKFINVPELRQLLALFADIRSGDELGLKRPAARYHTVVAPGSPQLRSYIADLSDRADRLAGKRQGGKGEDNMLKICSDGRKAALDPELVGIGGRARKLEAVVERIAAIYHASHGRTVPGLIVPEVDERFRTTVKNVREQAGAAEVLQGVFCDLGTPNKDLGDQVYGKIRAGLIRYGVPGNVVKFIHDANSDTAKASLFADCRAGKNVALLGSTDKLGVGTNVQRLMVAMHHVDAPWRPADVEQREGRGLRPGNLFWCVNVWRYVTRGSFDSYMWQTLERKERFIRQVLTGRSTAREVEDIGDGGLSAGEVKALATGNPALMEKAGAEAEAVKWRLRNQEHMRTQRRLRHDIDRWERRSTGCREDARAWQAIATVAAGHDRSDAEDHRGDKLDADALTGYLGGLAQDALQRGSTWRHATIRGVRVRFAKARLGFGKQELAVTLSGEHGHEMVVKMPDKWARPAQHGHIPAELMAQIDGAEGEAQRLLGLAHDYARRAAEAAALEGKPFPHADKLRAAEEKLADIEQQIRAKAQDQLENKAKASAGMPDDDENDAVEVHSDPWPEIPEHYRNPQPATARWPEPPPQPPAPTVRPTPVVAVTERAAGRRPAHQHHTGTKGCARVPVARQIRHAAEILGLAYEQVTADDGAPLHRVGGQVMTPMAAADYLLAGGFIAAMTGKTPVVRPERLAERAVAPQRASGSWARMVLSR